METAWRYIVQSLRIEGLGYFFIVFLLMLINWCLEARKWQLLIVLMQPLTLWQSFKAILSGQALALSTPNRLGEYAGRILYLEEGNRLRGVSLLFVANLSQLIITFTLGTIGLLIMGHAIESKLQSLKGIPINSYLYLTVSVALFVVTLFLFYYNLSWLALLTNRIKWLRKYHYLVEELEILSANLLTKLLALSLIRYSSFLIPYFLLMHLFGVAIPVWQSTYVLFVQFLVLAIVPSIALSEIGIRGQVSFALFGLLTHNLLGIIATNVSIWLINLILPALAGTFFILGIKFFKNNRL